MILKTGAQKIASFSCDEHERVPNSHYKTVKNFNLKKIFKVMNHVDANCNNKTYLKRSHSYTYVSDENLKNISAINL